MHHPHYQSKGLSFTTAFDDRIINNIVGTCSIELVQYDAALQSLRRMPPSHSAYQLLNTQKQLYNQFQPQTQTISQRHALLTGRYVLSYSLSVSDQQQEAPKNVTTPTTSSSPEILEELFDLAQSSSEINIASYDLTSSYTMASPFKFALVFSRSTNSGKNTWSSKLLLSSITDVKPTLPWLSQYKEEFDSFVLLFDRKRKRKLWKRCLMDIFGYPTSNVPKMLGLLDGLSDLHKSSTGAGKSSKRNSVISNISLSSSQTVTTVTSRHNSKQPSQIKGEGAWNHSQHQQHIQPQAFNTELPILYDDAMFHSDPLTDTTQSLIINVDNKTPTIPQKSRNRRSIQSFKAYTKRKFNISSQALDNPVSNTSDNSAANNTRNASTNNNANQDSLLSQLQSQAPCKPQRRTHSLVYYNNNNNHIHRRHATSAEDFYMDEFLQQALKESKFANGQSFGTYSVPSPRTSSANVKPLTLNKERRTLFVTAPPPPQRQPLQDPLPSPSQSQPQEAPTETQLTPQSTPPSLCHSPSPSASSSSHNTNKDQPDLLGLGDLNNAAGSSNLSILLTESFNIWAPAPGVESTTTTATKNIKGFEAELEELGAIQNKTSLEVTTPSARHSQSSSISTPESTESEGVENTSSISSSSSRSIRSSTSSSSSYNGRCRKDNLGYATSATRSKPAPISFQSLESWVSSQGLFIQGIAIDNPLTLSSLSSNPQHHHTSSGPASTSNSTGSPTSSATSSLMPYSSSEESLTSLSSTNFYYPNTNTKMTNSLLNNYNNNNSPLTTVANSIMVPKWHALSPPISASPPRIKLPEIPEK